MPSFPTLSSGQVCKYPVKRTSRRRVAVHQFCDFSEQRYAKGVELNEFELVLRHLTLADKETLRAFYIARQGEFDTTWSLTFDGSTYANCQFIGLFEPKLTGSIWWDVTLRIRSRGTPDFAPHDLTSDTSRAPYTASASTSAASHEPFRAFDGSAATAWLGTGGGSDWLQLDTGFGTLYTLSHYQIQVDTVPSPNQAPKNFTLQASNDGTTWTTLDTRTNETGWSSGQTRVYYLSAVSAPFHLFRLNISANNGDATYTQVGELYLIGDAISTGITIGTRFSPSNMTAANWPPPFVASASSTAVALTTYWPYRAFDGIWNSGNAGIWAGTGGGSDWLQLDCGAGNAYILAGYYIYGYWPSLPARAPRSWTMQGSNNGSTWTSLDSRIGEGSWNVLPGRYYACAPTMSTYRYFRLNIGANNGDSTFTAVPELQLYAPPNTPVGPAGAFPVLSTGAISQIPYTEIEQFYVTQEAIDSGKVSTYSWNPSGAPLPRYLVTYTDITAAELGTLQAFWNTMQGQLGIFSFVDDSGATHNRCGFDQPAFVTQYVGPGQYSLELKIAVKP